MFYADRSTQYISILIKLSFKGLHGRLYLDAMRRANVPLQIKWLEFNKELKCITFQALASIDTCRFDISSLRTPPPPLD